MGNYFSQENEKLLQNVNIDKDNIDKDIIISNKKKDNFNLNLINNKNNIEKFILTLTEEIEGINTKLNTLNEKIKNTDNTKRIKNNKNDKNDFIGFPMYNDYFFDEMRYEYIKKKKNKFKFEIKNDIKNKFISPILDSLKKKDKEILDLKSMNESLKSQLNNLNNQILVNNTKIKDEISKKIMI